MQRGTRAGQRPVRLLLPVFPMSSGPLYQFHLLATRERGGLTPTAKNNVKPREPKYAKENGIRSDEQMCFKSDH
jgi:hypothetical protein